MSKKQDYILYDKNIIKGLLILSIPVILSNILKSIHDIVDMYFVSKIDLVEEVVDAQTAAITVTGPIIGLFQALAIGFMIAGSAIMSQYLGASKYDKAKKVSGQLMLSCIVMGFLFNILLFTFAPLIMKLMNAEGLIYEYSVLYLRYRSFELLGLFVFYAFQATRQSTGDTVSPVIFNSVTIILNIILTAIFVYILKMDIRGAALATVIANMVIIPICIIFLIHSNTLGLNLEWEDLKYDKKTIKKLFIIGLPAAFSQALTSLGFALINAFSMKFPNYIISGIGAGNRINSLLLYPAMSVGGVLSTFVGQNIGAGNIERAKKSVKSAMIISLIIAVCGIVFLMPYREEVASILLKEGSDSINICANFLIYLLLGLPFMAIYQIFISCFQGAGRTDYSLIVSSLRLWVLRIPFLIIYLQFLDLGYLSIAYAMVISNIGAILLSYLYYVRVDFKPRVSSMLKNIKKLETN